MNSNNEILSFRLNSIVDAPVSIDHDNGVINIIVPYGTIVSNLTAEIQLFEEATVVPSGTVPQNFSNHIYYTVTAANGARKVYKVVVVLEAQPVPHITGFSRDTVRASERLLVLGKEFGRFDFAVKVYLVEDNTNTHLVNSRLLDSTKIDIGIPADLKPGLYTVKVVKDKHEARSERKLLVKIPPPEISVLRAFQILQGDSIIVAGNYIDPVLYDYHLKMVNESHSYTLNAVSKEAGKLSFAGTKGVLPGKYTVSLLNVREAIAGKPFGLEVRIYDDQMPFITYGKDAPQAYKAGSQIVLLASNFDKLTTRFYQLVLTSEGQQYNQSGIYDRQQKTLTFDLPVLIKAGSYQGKVLFLSESGQQLYDIELEGPVKVPE